MSMNLQVLLVEDDIDLAKTIIKYLEIQGINCDFASNGRAGFNLALENNYHVLLLDINLPRMTGLDICQNLRSQGIDTPILMLTARDSINDKLDGFNVGTDDYVVKPFVMEELVARVKALANRRSALSKLLTALDLSMDLNLKVAKRANKTLDLTPKGWIIFDALMRAHPNIVSKQTLEQAIWGEEPPDSNALKVHLHTLRQMVDKPFPNPVIHTIKNHGFVLNEK